jgi:Flp pilus assembly pilin Flp
LLGLPESNALIQVLAKLLTRGFAQKHCFGGRELKMKNQVKLFFSDESGQDVAEYALLLVLVGIAVAVASPTITDSILSVFSRTKSVLGV